MTLNIQKKQKIVSEIQEIAKKSLSAVIANVYGLNVNQINKLRQSSRKIGVKIFMIRNTLLYRAIKNTQFECLKKILMGPTLIAYSSEYAGAAARLFKEFSKLHKNFKIKGAAFEGSFIESKNIDYLANQLTYKEAIIQIIKVIKEASIGKLARTLFAIIKIKQQKN